MGTTSEELISLNKRLMSLELLARERVALSDAYMKKVEELKLELRDIESRMNAVEKTIGIIQARMAMITAGAAMAGAVVGRILIEVAAHFIP